MFSDGHCFTVDVVKETIFSLDSINLVNVWGGVWAVD